MTYATLNNILAIADLSSGDLSALQQTLIITHADQLLKTILSCDFSSNSASNLLYHSSQFFDNRILQLAPEYCPILTLSKVEVETGESGSFETKTEGWDHDYVVFESLGRIEFTYRLDSKGHNNVRLTFTYGASATPSDISVLADYIGAIILLGWKSRGFKKKEVVSYSSGGLSLGFAPNAEIKEKINMILPLAQEIIRKNRRRRFSII